MGGMTRTAVLIVLLAAGACGGTSRDLDQSFDAAQSAMRRGALDEALAESDRAMTLMRGDANAARAHEFRLLRAEILLTKPDLAAARALLDIELPSGEEFEALHARHRYLRARAQVAGGQLKEALAALEDVGRIASTARDVQLDAAVLGGQVRMRLGRWAEAEAGLRAVVTEAAERGDRYRQILALNNLGMGLVVRNRLDEALSWFEQVLSFTDLEEMSVYATAMNNAGACYARLGEFDRAVATQQRAVELHERRRAAGPYQQALGELGTTYLLLEDVPRGVQYLKRALAIASDADLTGDAALWARNLAAAHVHVGEWDEAERFNEEARRLTPSDRAGKLVFQTLHAADIAAGRHRYEDAARLYQETLDGAGAEPRMTWAAHDGLAGIALATGRKDRAAVHLEAALDTIERTRSDLLKTDYKLSFVTQLMRFYRTYVDLLVEQGDIERALAVADSSRGRVLAERHGIAPPAASNAAAFRRLARQSKSVLVSYWLTPDRSYVWVVDAHGVRMHTLPPAPDIEALVRAHQAAIDDALADPLAAPGSAGDQLYRLLVAPIRSSLPRDASVIIVADGALHRLNFESLPVDGASRHYWIEDVEIQIAPSLALLTANRAMPAPPKSLLVFGDPTPRAPEFPALRYASTEMTNIARHFDADRSRRYQGAEASPGAYRESHPEQFAFVHFTAHAAANVDSPLDSAVILSGSGQAFKLYARDVAELPLQAELVTVSACRGAGERAYSGEGLVGFAWAFLRAGARRVIAGLWDVDDRSTAELMDALYARLAAGDSVPRALRAAKLAMLRQGGTASKPYYWGPFQVFTMSPT
jgi:CHAT domain-containing protein